MAEFNLENYSEVKDRLKLFWAKYPQGRIITEMIHLDAADVGQRMVIVKAELYGDLEDERPLTTGLSQTREGTFGANKTAFIENCETSAVGRALANLGFSGDLRPSREEMEAVKRREEEQTVALQQIKKFAKMSPELRKRVEAVWESVKNDPVRAIQFAKELEDEMNAVAETK